MATAGQIQYRIGLAKKKHAKFLKELAAVKKKIKLLEAQVKPKAKKKAKAKRRPAKKRR